MRSSALDGNALVDALDHARDVQPARGREPVKRAPDRWLSAYADALRRCWPAVEPLWRRSLALLEQEEDRLHAAMERGVAPTQALAGVFPRLSIGYPLPASWRAFDGVAPPRASLEALLGRHRAALLRALDRPQSAGRLARMRACAPSALTHHLRASRPRAWSAAAGTGAMSSCSAARAAPACSASTSRHRTANVSRIGERFSARSAARQHGAP